MRVFYTYVKGTEEMTPPGVVGKRVLKSKVIRFLSSP